MKGSLHLDVKVLPYSLRFRQRITADVESAESVHGGKLCTVQGVSTGKI
jgi:hypothetical protein